MHFIDNDIEEFNNDIYSEDQVQDEESDDDEHYKQSVEALHYIAGYIAFKFKTKYQTLQSRDEKTKQKWILLKSQGLLVTPSEELNKLLSQCETIFCHFHGSTIDMNPNPMERLVENIMSTNIELPVEVVKLFVKLRFFSANKNFKH